MLDNNELKKKENELFKKIGVFTVGHPTFEQAKFMEDFMHDNCKWCEISILANIYAIWRRQNATRCRLSASTERFTQRLLMILRKNLKTINFKQTIMWKRPSMSYQLRALEKMNKQAWRFWNPLYDPCSIWNND